MIWCFVTKQVLLSNQVLDDRGACGGSAQTTFAHRISQLFVIDQFPSSFHSGKQCTVVVSGWGIGLFFLEFQLVYFCVFLRIYATQLILTSGLSRCLTIDRFKAGNDQNFTSSEKRILFDSRNSCRVLVFSGREKDRQKPPHNQVVNLLCVFVQFVRWKFSSWDNRKVIANFFGVKNSFCVGDSVVIDDPFGALFIDIQKRIVCFCTCKIEHRFTDFIDVIFWKILRIGTRIGQQFVAVVTRLSQL